MYQADVFSDAISVFCFGYMSLSQTAEIKAGIRNGRVQNRIGIRAEDAALKEGPFQPEPEMRNQRSRNKPR